MEKTPIFKIDNHLYIKREDFIPFSFGGNKARKAFLFFEDFDSGDYDCVVTYGSSSSNHCRIIANIAAARNIPCYIISPLESSKETYNKKLMKMFGAEMIFVSVEEVSETIDNTLTELRSIGKKPYFIQGGGHGNIGTQAYVNCYNEIKEWEKENNVVFDYLFFASGTGTTQAGLVCGKILNNDDKIIVGISVARSQSKGKKIIIDSIKDYLKNDIKGIEEQIIFLDDYVGNGYADENKNVKATIKLVMSKYGIPLDSVYTGKAFYGMNEYIKSHNIKEKNILFIHTGGTPLFFDSMD